MGKPNNLGIGGWFYAGRYSLQRYAYTFQRLTGIGIILYLLAHIYVTGFKTGGTQVWDSAMATVHHPLLHFGEFLVMLAIVIHALNGFRLILVEFGLVVGKPIKNVYPYETCLDRHRAFFTVIVILIVVLAAVGVADFFHFI